MPCMQIAHGGDEANILTNVGLVFKGFSEIGNGLDNLHRRYFSILGDQNPYGIKSYRFGGLVMLKISSSMYAVTIIKRL